MKRDLFLVILLLQLANRIIHREIRNLNNADFSTNLSKRENSNSLLAQEMIQFKKSLLSWILALNQYPSQVIQKKSSHLGLQLIINRIFLPKILVIL